jgi:hypothetical protein
MRLTRLLRASVSDWSVVACVAFVTLVLPACGQNCGACSCPPGDCPEVRTHAAVDAGKTVVIEVGQWISLELPGPNTNVTASSSEPTVLKLVGKDRFWYGNDGKVATVYMSFHALKAGSAQLTLGYNSCDQTAAAQCSYAVNVRVVQFPKTKTTVWVSDSPPASVQLHVGESVRFSACCRVVDPGHPDRTIDQPMPTVDRTDVLKWAVEPFIDHQQAIEGAVTAVAPGTAHIQGIYCPMTAGSYCPSAWSVTVTVA